MADKRIIDQITDAALQSGDYVIVDSTAEGSRKYDLGGALAGINTDIGDLSALDTTAKSNLVAAINEAAQSGGGSSVTVDSALSSTSENPVQNKVINTALGNKANTSDLAAVATSGSYNDLSNKPTIPSITGLQTQAITDTGGYFSTDTVEAALQQLGATVDGIETLLAAI